MGESVGTQKGILRTRKKVCAGPRISFKTQVAQVHVVDSYKEHYAESNGTNQSRCCII